MAGKLKNLQAIRQMLDGTHAKQTNIIIPKAERKDKEIRRNVGDVWYDDEGVKYEQKKGYVVRHGKLEDIRTELREFKNCNKEVCECTYPTRLDLKFKGMVGKCSNCVFEEETQMKIDGKYDNYETQKVYDNAQAWLKEAEQEKELIKQTYTEQLQFVNQNGKTEDWEGMPSVEELITRIDDEFEKFKKEFLLDLEKKLEKNP